MPTTLNTLTYPKGSIGFQIPPNMRHSSTDLFWREDTFEIRVFKLVPYDFPTEFARAVYLGGINHRITHYSTDPNLVKFKPLPPELRGTDNKEAAKAYVEAIVNLMNF